MRSLAPLPSYCAALLLAVIAFASPARAAETAVDSTSRAAPPDSVSSTSRAATRSSPDQVNPTTDRIAIDAAQVPEKLGQLGFENLGVSGTGDTLEVSFENRRYRHTAEAMGRIASVAGTGAIGFERRLGLTAAAIVNSGTADAPRFHVRYPSDPNFPRAPRAEGWRTSKSVDFTVGPLLGYEFGRPYQPVQFQVQIEPSVHYNPWPGARATASIVFPIYNDFQPSELHPDEDRVRPGLITLEQYAWAPGLALLSGTVGLFGDNRYGISVGAARPLFEGQILLDAQADVTGVISFWPGGLVYSSTDQFSSYAGITWRPPFLDIALNARVAQFLYGDQGQHVEFRRSMGDVDFAFFAFKAGHFEAKGVKITVPVPPIHRATQRTVRAQPIERFPFSYRTETEAVGIFLTGVASREEFLRQLSTPSLNANNSRYRNALRNIFERPEPKPVEWVSLSGMTGFINTPWSGTISDRAIELGASHIPKKWSQDRRGRFANEPWTMTLGLIPRVEAGLRFTRIPGLRGGVDDPDSKITTDTDHMASWRLSLLTPKGYRPGLAIGMDDIEGTRRFHSSYAVAGLPFAILRVQNRLSLGYAFDVFTAARHVLDGGFGAFEVSPWRVVATRVEYDTEKWNTGIGVALPHGIRLRAAMLNLETLSVGAGWYHEL